MEAYYDMAMLVVLVGATLFGLWKGMAWQLASLASLLLSYFVSLRFSEAAAPIFGSQAPWNRFVAMLVLYLATSAAIWLGFRFVAAILDRVKLREFDRQIGAIFGLAKGALLCIAITFFAVSLAPAEVRKGILNSRSGHYIGLILSRADALMPKEIHEIVDPYLHPVRQELDSDGQPVPVGA